MNTNENNFTAQINALHTLFPELASSLTEACENHDGGVQVLPQGGEEYVVYTCEQAEQIARERFKDEIWSYTPSFLGRFMPEWFTEAMVSALTDTGLCEDLNAPLRALIEAGRGMDEAFEEATMDGYGHLLSPYDHEENEAGEKLEFLVYRIN